MAASKVSDQTHSVIKRIDVFQVFYTFGNVRIANINPYTYSEGGIYLYSRNRDNSNELVAMLRFVDDETHTINSIIPVGDHQVPVLFFKASKFNDVINILRYQKPLSISYDLRLTGSLSGDFESIGQQE